MLRKAFGISTALLTLGVGVVVAAPAAMADNVCEGYSGAQVIRSLGGANAFSKQSVGTLEDLRWQVDKNRAVFEQMLQDKGLGHLSAALLDAVKTGEGVSERQLAQGEVLQWMAWRKRGKPTASGPLCVKTRKDYDAFEIRVATEEVIRPGKAVCALRANGDCEGGKLSVDASGSSEGVQVTMGSKTIVSGGSTSWSGAFDNPYTTDYSFTATAKAQGTKKVTTHTFLIPKVCVNLSYLGSTTAEVAGDVDTCEKTVEVKRCPDPPSCKITVTPSNIKKRQSATIEVDGNWEDGGLSVTVKDASGANFANPETFPATVEFGKCGNYSVMGTATKHGKTVECNSETVHVCKKNWVVPAAGGGTQKLASCSKGNRWTLRGMGALMGVDSDEDFRSALRAQGDGFVNERSHLSVSDATGIGADLEYCATDRVGILGSLLLLNLDTRFQLDLDDAWDMTDDDVGFTGFSIGPSFHLTPNSRFDFFLGPVFGWAKIGDASYRVLGETVNRDFDDEFFFGLQAGVDIPFGESPWALTLGARYFDLDVRQDGVELSLDPLTGLVGFAYHF